IQSKDVLKEALKSYDGTFLLVSHDRDFLHDLTNRLLELDEFRIRDQHMDILELIEKRKALQGADIGKSSERTNTKSGKGNKANKSDQGEKRERDKERRQVQNQVQRLEKQLAELEQEEKQLQSAVMKGGTAAAEVQKGYESMGEIAKRIATTMKEWEDASVRLEELGEEKTA
ncbi:MAG: hypothetical protein IPP83_16755, partial [Flavobacteriales bacterium]|nr:hypothetical protein [Flavobacteriales bacterium]